MVQPDMIFPIPNPLKARLYVYISSYRTRIILGSVSIYQKDVFEIVADRNAASSLAESSQTRLLVIETHLRMPAPLRSPGQKMQFIIQLVQAVCSLIILRVPVVWGSICLRTHKALWQFQVEDNDNADCLCCRLPRPYHKGLIILLGWGLFEVVVVCVYLYSRPPAHGTP